MNWLIGIALVVIIGYLLDREIYFYEGVHLGPRVQAWLYDRWSRKYDEGKRESQLRDDEMLARPLLERLKDVPEPFVLDFATGTGRFSYALISQPGFKGQIVALDLSQGMLEQASEKLHAGGWGESSPRVEFLRHQILPLPFPDSTFDVVCALEVLELFPNMAEPLAEFARVLRPGGVLLTSRGTEESGRKAKVKSKPAYTSLLEKHDFLDVEITPWWKLFDRVFARRAGASSSVGRRKLSAVLRCGSCQQVEWESEAHAWRCRACGHRLSITMKGVVLN